MRRRRFLRQLAVAAALPLGSAVRVMADEAKGPGQEKTARWRGVHVMAPGPQEMPLLKRAILEALVPLGVNTLIFEVDYDFEFQSHPELRGDRPLTRENARDLAALCRDHGIRLIPLFNCLGHQSWAKQTGPLLTKYSELDAT